MSLNIFNAEHYCCPTEHDAIANVMREEKRKNYRPLVYICSPYAGDVETNAANARRYSRYAVERKCIPVAPHLLFPQFMNDDVDEERKLGLFFGKVLLDKCREIWVFGACSSGMASELRRARRKNMNVRRFRDDGATIEEVTECGVSEV